MAVSGRLQFLSLQCKRNRLELVQHKTVKIVKGLEYITCKWRHKEMGLFSLEKRKLRWDFIALLEVCRDHRTSLFSVTAVSDSKGNSNWI